MNQEESKPRTDQTKSESETATQEAPRWIRPEGGAYEAFSDLVHVNWTPLVLRIRFGQIMPDPEGQPGIAPWVVMERADVTIPWFQVKALHDLLGNVLGRYEQKNGPIPLPEMPD
jgi:hypothetical protein